MYKGIECEYNKEKCIFYINTLKTTLKLEQKTIEIENKEIKNVYTKNLDSGQFPYLLKLTSKENYIIAFRSQDFRELLSNFYKIQENEEDNTKSFMIKYIIEKPLLVEIFDEMNCSLTKFINYLRESYFFSLKNKKNVIDRFLNEKIRSLPNFEDNFASRINTISFMQINNENILETKEKEVCYDEVDILPEFVANKENEIIINDFKFGEKIDLRISLMYEKDEDFAKKNYDKKDLKELVELCKQVWAKGDSKELQDKIKQYKNYLDDPNLETFSPLRYINKK